MTMPATMAANASKANMLPPSAVQFLERTPWRTATCEPLTGDASARRYFRLRQEDQSAILMDASQCLESMEPFIRIDEHLLELGFSAPQIIGWHKEGFMLLEDFGDATFTRLLEENYDQEKLYKLGTDVLIGLHRNPKAIPAQLRSYTAEKMVEDLEVFLEWCAPRIPDLAKEQFRRLWEEPLARAHGVPSSLLLRDYHVANLMLLPGRTGVRETGLLDFQDAYQGPVTYDLMSLLEDARRDVPDKLKLQMTSYYLSHFPALDRNTFAESMAVLAAVRHTRVLAIFERLSLRDGKHEYKAFHSPRVQRLLERALQHPSLAGLRDWFAKYAK